MSSEGETHIALINCLRTLEEMGGGNEKVTYLDGGYSHALVPTISLVAKSKYIRERRQTVSVLNSIGFKEVPYDKAPTISQILRENEKDDVLTCICRTLTITKPYERFVESLYQNETFYVPFKFRHWNFQPGWWKRYRIRNKWPSMSLFERMEKTKERMKEILPPPIFKRYRPTLLVNKPSKKIILEEDMREICHTLWHGLAWSLKLRKRGNFFDVEELEEL